MMKVAILEDDTLSSELLADLMEDLGYKSDRFKTGAALMRKAAQGHYDIYLIDYMLPDTSGEKVTSWIRSRFGWRCPIIFLSAYGEEDKVIAALDSGADEYLLKPVRYQELKSRIHAILRRSRVPVDTETTEAAAEPNYVKGPFSINLINMQLKVNGERSTLRPREVELLHYLLKNTDSLVTREELALNVWGVPLSRLNPRTIDTHISQLRSKLLKKVKGWEIKSARGLGYRLIKP